MKQRHRIKYQTGKHAGASPIGGKGNRQMTTFANTDAAAEFIATANSRETSKTVMEAITQFAADAAEAETIWENGLNSFDDQSAKAFIDTATRDGTIDLDDLCWGASTGLEIVPASLRHEYEPASEA